MNRPLRFFAPLLFGAALALHAADGPMSNTIIDGDHFESQSTDQEMTSYFTGHVVVTGNDLHMTCDKLKVITIRTGSKADTVTQQNQFKYLLATGNVHIVQGNREATCGQAEVLPQDNKITLTENPVVTDRDNGSVVTGDKLMLLRGERRVIVDRPHMIGPPIKDLGFDKSAPPAPPSKQP